MASLDVLSGGRVIFGAGLGGVVSEFAKFGEPFAPDESFGRLLGQSIYFYSKDVGRPVRYVPPSFALDASHSVPIGQYQEGDDAQAG